MSPRKPRPAPPAPPAPAPATEKPARAKSARAAAPADARPPTPAAKTAKPAETAQPAPVAEPAAPPPAQPAPRAAKRAAEASASPAGASAEPRPPREPDAEPAQRATVPAEREGERLDRVLVELWPELSRARARAMLEAGQVRVNGRRARKGDAVPAGAEVTLLAPPPPRDFSPVAQPELTVPLRYESALVAVFDKPAGMPTHPLRPDERGTLANASLARFPETAGVGFALREPGLLHRLDTDTSGVLLVARSADAFVKLRDAAREGHVHKRYLALVEGVVESEGRVEYPLVPHRKDPKRVEAVTPNVRLRAGTRTFEARTSYRPRARLRTPAGEFTLLEVELTSAFRHQVRVHLATIGHPLVGDALYRGPALPAPYELGRHFLHAAGLRFPDPETGAERTVESPLPDDLASVLRALAPDARV